MNDAFALSDEHNAGGGKLVGHKWKLGNYYLKNNFDPTIMLAIYLVKFMSQSLVKKPKPELAWAQRT
jgi:hypothetical protein